eukprot:m.173888 g.173888  ORF g.173888 m.173888 type:complete len:352 (+) comp24336_c0_seq12:1458-2513(+)
MRHGEQLASMRKPRLLRSKRKSSPTSAYCPHAHAGESSSVVAHGEKVVLISRLISARSAAWVCNSVPRSAVIPLLPPRDSTCTAFAVESKVYGALWTLTRNSDHSHRVRPHTTTKPRTLHLRPSCSLGAATSRWITNVPLGNDLSSTASATACFESRHHTPSAASTELNLRKNSPPSVGSASISATVRYVVGIIPSAVPSVRTYCARSALSSIWSSTSRGYIAQDARRSLRCDLDRIDAPLPAWKARCSCHIAKAACSPGRAGRHPNASSSKRMKETVLIWYVLMRGGVVTRARCVPSAVVMVVGQLTHDSCAVGSCTKLHPHIVAALSRGASLGTCAGAGTRGQMGLDRG